MKKWLLILGLVIWTTDGKTWWFPNYKETRILDESSVFRSDSAPVLEVETDTGNSAKKMFFLMKNIVAYGAFSNKPIETHEIEEIK